jgi:hypothetical protein
MYKMWFGLAFAAIVVNPASAQDYQRNFVECVKELGFAPDTGYDHRIQDGRVLHRWYLYNEAQAAVLNDCVARKASLASSLTLRDKAGAAQ